MNHDDPKLTAYALNELSPGERAEIEALLKEQPLGVTEVQETKEMGSIMRQLFRAELTETLTPGRREAILRAAIAPAAPPVPAPKNVITPHPAWWRRTSTWQWAAACVVFGFGVYAISSTLTSKTQTSSGGLAGTSGVEVHVGGMNDQTPANDSHQPDFNVPPDHIANGNSFGSPVLPAPGGNKIGNVKAPKPAIDLPRLESVEAKRMASNDAGSVPHRPTVTGGDPSRPNLHPELMDHGQRPGTKLGAPSYGAANPGDKKTLHGDMSDATLTAEDASRYLYATQEFLNKRWQEASTVRPGDTYGDLAKVFRPDGGSQPEDAQRFVMIRCPFIKVDVKFATETGSVAWPVSPGTHIRSISKPYFEPEQQ